MRKTFAVLVCLLITLGPAAADEQKPAEPPKLLTTAQAVDAVLKALKAQDDAALKALAQKDDPDP